MLHSEFEASLSYKTLVSKQITSVKEGSKLINLYQILGMS